MPVELKLPGTDGDLAITFTTVEAGRLLAVEDAYCLPIEVQVRSGGFSGMTPDHFLWPPDLVAFERDLREAVETLSGEALLDDDLGFRCQVRLEKGHGHIEGSVARIAPAHRFEFSFETDQSYLSPALTALCAVVATIPEQRR